jgi:MFS transporter, MHS family, proline/betaine transporter
VISWRRASLSRIGMREPGYISIRRKQGVNMTTTSFPISGAVPGSATRTSFAVLAGTIGNVLEWYDYAVFAFLVPVLSKLFFPASNPAAGILLTLAVLGSGLAMRPIGAVIFAVYGDKIGRRGVLLAVSVTMGLATFAIGLLPTYETAGILAPVLLLALRLIQGLSMGGEWGPSATFIIEHAQIRRGFFGSLHIASLALGFCLGSVAVMLLNFSESASEIVAGGWRIPFLLGIVLAGFGVLIRVFTSETPSFVVTQERHDSDNQPLRDVFTSHGRALLTIFIYAINVSFVAWLGMTYMTTYYITILKMAPSAAITIVTIGLAVMCLLCPLVGWLSDKIGRKPIAIASCVAPLVVFVPLLKLASTGDYSSVMIANLGFIVCVSLCATVSTLFIETFPTSVRCTGVSLAYNFSQAIFGGFAPFLAQYLISLTGSIIAPAYIVVVGAAVGLIPVLMMKETAFEPLMN